MDLRDAYRVLKVPPGSSKEAIKKQWRILARINHPDRLEADPALRAVAEVSLAEINEAYALLESLGFPEGQTTARDAGHARSQARDTRTHDYRARPDRSQARDQPRRDSKKPAPNTNERQLCSDGACIGVIDDNGRCKVCGVAPNSCDDDHDHDEDHQATRDEDRKLCADGACVGVIGDNGKCKVCGLGSESDDEADEDDEPDGADHRDEGYESRKLCHDGACIGVIGSNGRCKVCGKAS